MRLENQEEQNSFETQKIKCEKGLWNYQRQPSFNARKLRPRIVSGPTSTLKPYEIRASNSHSFPSETVSSSFPPLMNESIYAKLILNYPLKNSPPLPRIRVCTKFEKSFSSFSLHWAELSFRNTTLTSLFVLRSIEKKSSQLLWYCQDVSIQNNVEIPITDNSLCHVKWEIH